MKQVNLGIIGLGYQGKLHLRNALRLKEAKVLGVADASEKSLRYAKKLGVKNVCKDYEDLLKSSELDAVVISLPNFLHLESAVKAAEAGKDILLEKPLARNVDEGEKIASNVANNGVRLMLGYTFRFHPAYKEVRDKIVDGFFGNVQIAEATNVTGGPFASKSDKVGPIQVPSWWFDKELSGGGALLDLGSHMIDLLSWYFGDVDSVKSYLGYMFNMDLEDAAICMLRFKDGPLATVKVGWFSKKTILSVRVCGTAENAWVGSPSSFARVRTLAWKNVKSRLGWLTNEPGYLELEHFVKCLQRDEQPRPSGEDGLRCQRLVELAYENSSRKRSHTKILEKEA